MLLLTRLSPLVQASSRMQLMPTTTSTCIRLISTSYPSTIKFTCPLAKAPTMSQVNLKMYNVHCTMCVELCTLYIVPHKQNHKYGTVIKYFITGWSRRSRNSKEAWQGKDYTAILPRNLSKRSIWELGGGCSLKEKFRWTCTSSKRQRRGTRRGPKCTGG